jgi:hypothetical protein
MHYMDLWLGRPLDRHMKNFLVAMALLALPAVASAQQVVINFGWSAPPPLVVVQPGVQVVENADEEVFFIGGRYWVERGDHWYWSRDHRSHWVVEDRRRVPVFLLNHRRGEYVHWRRAEHERRAADRREERELRHEEHEMRHEEHREMKREAKRERDHEDHEHGHHHD